MAASLPDDDAGDGATHLLSGNIGQRRHDEKETSTTETPVHGDGRLAQAHHNWLY